jgi:hypothetical protein
MNKSKEVQNLKDKLKRRDNKIETLKEKNRQLEEKVHEQESANKKKALRRKVVSDEQERLLSELLADIGLMN